jgi:hypothetical protein
MQLDGWQMPVGELYVMYLKDYVAGTGFNAGRAFRPQIPSSKYRIYRLREWQLNARPA